MSNSIRIPAQLRTSIRVASGVTAAAAAGTALAFVGVPGYLDMTQTARPMVEVRSTNGELYNDVKSGGQIGLSANGACDIQGNGNEHPVKSLEITAEDWPGQTATAYLDALEHNANNLPVMPLSFPDGIYPQGVDYPAAWRDRAISACNANLNQKIAQGMSKNQVLAKAWDLKKVPLDELRGTLVCGNAKAGGGFTEPGGIYEKAVPVSIDVRCLKYSLDQVQATPKEPSTPGASDDVKMNVGVTQAALAMVPNQYEGTCPAQLTASGTIVTNGPTKVKYRLENDKGQLSTTGTIDIDQTNTGYFVIKLPIGHAVSGSAPGGGAQGTMVAAAAGGGGGSASGTIAAQAPPPNVYQGFWRVVTEAPNQVTSKPSSFKVTCKAPLANELAAPGGQQQHGIFAPISTITSKGKEQEGSGAAGGGSNARDGTSSTFLHGEKATRAPGGSAVKPSATKKTSSATAPATTPATPEKGSADETKRRKPATSPAPSTSR